MTPTIAVAVLFSALLHAIWNSLAHNVNDRLVGFALIGVVDMVGGGALALIAGFPPAGAWPFIIASAVLHVAYNLLLLASYQLGEFSQMYPLARGTSPWIVALVSVVVLGNDLPPRELAGVVAISAGLAALVFIGGRPSRHDVPALTAALLTGVMIAAYTVVDGLGVREAPLAAYIGWMFLLQGPPIAVLAVIRRGGDHGRSDLAGRLLDRAVGADQRGPGADRRAAGDEHRLRCTDRDGVPRRAARRPARDRIGGGVGRGGADQRGLTSAAIAVDSAACASSAEISPAMTARAIPSAAPRIAWMAASGISPLSAKGSSAFRHLLPKV